MKPAAARMGGNRRISVFLKGNEDLADSLLAIGEGGNKLAKGLRQRVIEAYGGQFEIEIRHEPLAPGELSLASASPPSPEPTTHLFQISPDVVVFSVESEVTGSAPVERFRREFARWVADIKERLAAHIIVFNCFAFDPHDRTRSHFGVQETLSLRALKFNVALIDFSTEEGISIIDVDRILAELGGGAHVTEAFRYSPLACELIRDEFLRVLQDIGFFERRPLLMQAGRKRA